MCQVGEEGRTRSLDSWKELAAPADADMQIRIRAQGWVKAVGRWSECVRFKDSRTPVVLEVLSLVGGCDDIRRLCEFFRCCFPIALLLSALKRTI